MHATSQSTIGAAHHVLFPDASTERLAVLTAASVTASRRNTRRVSMMTHPPPERLNAPRAGTTSSPYADLAARSSTLRDMAIRLLVFSDFI